MSAPTPATGGWGPNCQAPRLFKPNQLIDNRVEAVLKTYYLIIHDRVKSSFKNEYEDSLLSNPWLDKFWAISIQLKPSCLDSVHNHPPHLWPFTSGFSTSILCAFLISFTCIKCPDHFILAKRPNYEASLYTLFSIHLFFQLLGINIFLNTLFSVIPNLYPFALLWTCYLNIKVNDLLSTTLSDTTRIESANSKSHHCYCHCTRVLQNFSYNAIHPVVTITQSKVKVKWSLCLIN
jgi:hypothetical protein